MPFNVLESIDMKERLILSELLTFQDQQSLIGCSQM